MREKEQFIKLKLFWEFFKIGMFTIGGGLAMIPLISKIAVEDKKWISEKEMLDCVAISQVVPGVIAINTATFVGYKKDGIKGGIVATLGVILPSFLIILALINVLSYVENEAFVKGALIGIKASVAGLVSCVVYTIGKQNLEGWISRILAVIAFVLVIIFKINAILIVCGCGIFGATYFSYIEKKKVKK